MSDETMDSNDVPPNRAVTLHSVLWVLSGVTTVFICLRLFCKLRERRVLWLDDYFLVVSWVHLPPVIFHDVLLTFVPDLSRRWYCSRDLPSFTGRRKAYLGCEPCKYIQYRVLWINREYSGDPQSGMEQNIIRVDHDSTHRRSNETCCLGMHMDH
jgi:hypothetical protein